MEDNKLTDRSAQTYEQLTNRSAQTYEQLTENPELKALESQLQDMKYQAEMIQA
jgi:hypothetical protein